LAAQLRQHIQVAIIVSRPESLDKGRNHLRVLPGNVFVNSGEVLLLLLDSDRGSSELVEILETLFVVLKDLDIRFQELLFLNGFLQFRYCRLQNSCGQLDENLEALIGDLYAVECCGDVSRGSRLPEVLVLLVAQLFDTLLYIPGQCEKSLRLFQQPCESLPVHTLLTVLYALDLLFEVIGKYAIQFRQIEGAVGQPHRQAVGFEVIAVLPVQLFPILFEVSLHRSTP
jgi:hypothetical protein